MESLAWYRVYRPQSFDELVGQEEIVKMLRAVLAAGAPIHAYLFAGSRGTGKTSVARILAQELKTDPRDLYEIDAASNRGVDEIRELKEAVITRPFASKYKVYIIDEVHMLTREAFNALLKTLEEPPGHVIFILATTEINKLPETVVSRCQVFNFRQPSNIEVATILERIASREKIKLGEGVTDLISLLAEGSFRDAIGILQKVASGGEKQISAAVVAAAAGAPRQKLIADFLLALADEDLATALAIVNNVSQENYPIKIFAKLVLRQLRLAMVVFFAPQKVEKMLAHATADEAVLAQQLAKHPRARGYPKILKELLLAYDELGFTAVPTLPLELALINLLEKQKTD